jgi:hypothetical protein
MEKDGCIPEKGNKSVRQKTAKGKGGWNFIPLFFNKNPF